MEHGGGYGQRFIEFGRKMLLANHGATTHDGRFRQSLAVITPNLGSCCCLQPETFPLKMRVTMQPEDFEIRQIGFRHRKMLSILTGCASQAPTGIGSFSGGVSAASLPYVSVSSRRKRGALVA